MTPRWLAVVFSGSALTARAAEGDADKLRVLEQTITRMWTEHRSMTFRFNEDSRMVVPDRHSFKAEGTREIVRHGEVTKSRSESTYLEVRDVEGKEVRTDPKRALNICDGKYRYNHIEGESTAGKWPADDCEHPVRRFLWLKDRYDLKLAPDEKIDGQDAFVVEVSRKGVPFREWLLYYRKDGALLKQINFDFDKTIRSTIVYRDIQFDVPLEPRRFAFVAPEGVRVEERTRGDAAKTDK